MAARGDFYALAAASYAMSFTMGQRELQQLYRTLTWAALVLLVLTLYRWLVFYLPIKSLLPPVGIYNNDGEIRVVWANAALLMAEAAVLGAQEMRERGFLSRVLADGLVADDALGTAARVAKLAPQAARLNKRTIRALSMCGSKKPHANHATNSVADEWRDAYAYASSAEHREGVTAFIDKRQPRF